VVSPLYDRDRLFGGLVEPFVNLAVAEDRRLALKRPGDVPVVLLAGGRGMGKSVVLEYLRAHYGNRVPVALADLEALRLGPTAEAGEAESMNGGPADAYEPDASILNILRHLVWDLEPSVPWGGGIRFPRFSLALLAIMTWQAQDDRAMARRRLADARRSASSRRQSKPRGSMNEWIADASAELAGVIAPFPLGPILKASVLVLGKRTLDAIEQQAPLNWYGDYAPEAALNWHKGYDSQAAGDGYDALLGLARDFYTRSDDHAARANQALVAAFIADIAAEYHGISGFNRPASPVILLDNTQSRRGTKPQLGPAGTRLLDLLLERRAPRADAHRKADPLVVIATYRGDPHDCYQNARRVDANEFEHGWRWQLKGSEPRTGLLQVDLSGLSRPHVLRMLDTADPRRLSPDLSHLIHRLTGGHPMGADVITTAVAAAVPRHGPKHVPEVITPRSLLSLPVPGTSEEPVWMHLLRRLIPGERERSALVMLAAAHDDAGQALASAPETDSGHPGQGCLITLDVHALSDAEEFLRVNGWGPGPDYFVSDPFLRVLLLYALHQVSPADLRPNWSQVHDALRTHYHDLALLAQDDTERRALDTARLYHCLALGEPDAAADQFCGSFAGTAHPWLADLCAVVRAPYFGPDDSRRAVALGAANEKLRHQAPLYRSVSRLLHAAWYLHDPLVAPDAEVIERLAHELRFLAGQHPADNDILFNASRTWSAHLRRWEQGGDWLGED
jgi:hypothetical protein